MWVRMMGDGAFVPWRARRRVAMWCVALVVGSLGAAVAQGDAEALWSRLASTAAEVPRDGFDPAAVVARVGTDPEALFAWVRDETRPIAYRGALKGAAGTLLDRAGNALDRALLLRALLHEAGHASSLARGELSPEGAEALAQVIRAARPASPVPAADDAAATERAALADRAAAELGLDAESVRTELERAANARADRQRTLSLRADRQVDALLALLEAPGAAESASSLTDHWWVELPRPSGEPLALDPSLPQHEPGDLLTDATARYDFGSLAELAAVDGACADLTCGDRLHSVLVRAVAEVTEEGARTEHVLLERELIPAELLGGSVTLGVTAYGGPDDLEPFAVAAPADALLAAMSERDEWQPRLAVGPEIVIGRVVTAQGEVLDTPGGAASGGGGMGGLGFGGLGGGFGGGGGDDAEEGRGRFSAFWWTFEVRTPGLSPTTERRVVFDLVGPAERSSDTAVEPAADEATRVSRALALAGQTELALWTAAPTAELFALLTIQRLLDEREAWEALYVQGTDLPMAEVNERLNALSALRTPTERFALERAAHASANGAGPATALTVVAHHRRLRPDLTTEGGFDLVASAPGADAIVDDAFRARLRAGVADTVLEALLTASDDRPGGRALAEAFEREPASWRLVRTADGLAGSALPADLVALATLDLAAGFVLVVPTAAEDAVGWWRIDPASGATLGVGDRGWGQAMTGYAERANVVLQLRSVLHQYASMGRCLGFAISQPLQGVTGVGDELAECVFNLVCGQVNAALGSLVEADTNWTNVIILNTIDALWGGVNETGFGGFCGALWKKLR